MTGANAQGIELTLQRFAECYASGNPSGSTVKIVAGVTNDVVNDPDSAVNIQHGRAWGDLISRLNVWTVQEGLNSQVSFNGGLDAEHSFSTNPNSALNWHQGYRETNGNWNLFFYGDAQGCATDDAPGWTCQYPKADIESLAWTAGETSVFPQIYDEPCGGCDPPTSLNAQQWQRLSLDAYLVYGRMNFSGGLSQKADCSPNCQGAGLGPKDSWRDLWDEVNCAFDDDAFECKTADSLRWTTNIASNQATPSP